MARDEQLREIVQAMATYRGAFHDGIGVYRCDFCGEREAEETHQPITHTADCPVTKARALLGEEERQP